ncbi:S24/S26 family peptidase [Peribacillus frigoritolerans]|uniref:S24/S26 family peptidase n=1 Tax=Peribacillus frigoritolerans TaxID=450367 RepID=UPI0034E0B676
MNYKNKFIKKALTLHKSVNITIDGSCMYPLLKDGERTLVNKAEKYCEGDIILYEDGKERLVCHRINYTDSEVAITSGDNNLLFDPPIHYRDILGKLNFLSNNYKNSNSIVSMNYKTYLASKIDESHSILILNTISNENQENEFIQFSGSLPSKKQKLILLRGLKNNDIQYVSNLNLNGHVIEKGIAFL